MKRSIQLRNLLCSFLFVLSGVWCAPLGGQTPLPCPPGGEAGDYGTGCSPSFAIVYGGFATASTLLSADERAVLFSRGDGVVGRVQAFLNSSTDFPRLDHSRDYFNSPAWSRWYNTEKDDLAAARLYYWSIYTSSQDLTAAEQTRALQGMRDTTALLATGHLLFGQQFLLRANNLRYAEDLGSDLMIQREQCLLSGTRFQSNCEYADSRANADYQFEEVLTDYTHIFGLSLRDRPETRLGQYLGTREIDLFRLAVERSEQVNDAVARNLFALGDELRPRTVYRDVASARYVQTAAIIDTLIQGPREQAITLATQLTTLRQSAQNLIQHLNPLGIDLNFSPLLAYSDARDLALDALSGPAGALQLETDARRAAADYNSSLQRQRQELANIRNYFHRELAILCGLTTDQAQSLTEDQIGTLCDNDNAVVKQKFNLMQTSIAAVQAVQQRLLAILERLSITLDRKATVAHARWTAGQQLAALAYMAELLRGFTITASQEVSFDDLLVGSSVTISYQPPPELAEIASTREMTIAARDVQIANANSAAAVRNALLDEAYEARNLEVAAQSANAAIVEYNNTVHRVRTLIALRDQAVRDSQQDHETINVLRIQYNRAALDALAKFSDAIRRTYLMAKVVEYETVRQLPSELNPSALFKLRRATELSNYLMALHQYRTSFDFSSYLNRFTYQNISLTRDLLGFNRAALQCDAGTGLNCRACFFDDLPTPVCCNSQSDVQCQQSIFQELVRRSTFGDAGGPQVLVIEFATPLDATYPDRLGAIFLPRVGGNKLAGIGNPVPESNGVWITFRSSQTPSPRPVAVRLTQSGHSLYRNANGCVLELSPRSPLAFLPYPLQVNPDETSAVIEACPDGDAGCNHTRAFLRRSVYASNWQLEVEAGPGTSNPNLALDRLQDITLNLDTTGFAISGTCQE